MLQGEPRVHGRCSEGTVDWRAGRLAGGSNGEVVRECHGEAPAVALRQWLFLLQRRGHIKVLYRRERSRVCLKVGGEQWVVMETGRCFRRSRGLLAWQGRHSKQGLTRVSHTFLCPHSPQGVPGLLPLRGH